MICQDLKLEGLVRHSPDDDLTEDETVSKATL
jgi:hypothetical protein